MQTLSSIFALRLYPSFASNQYLLPLHLYHPVDHPTCLCTHMLRERNDEALVFPQRYQNILATVPRNAHSKEYLEGNVYRH